MKLTAYFFALRVTLAFLLLFLWLFLPHRYQKAASLGIVSACYLLTGFLDFVISEHITQSIDMAGVAVLLAEMLICLGTAMLLGEHRDTRSLFVGLSACAYSFDAFLFGSLAYYFSDNSAAAIAGQTVFNVAVLWLLCRRNRRMPLTELLADKSGRAKLCFVPLICSVSIFISSVWPGNIFTTPICRPISILMLILMYIYYQLVITLLRVQSNRSWLKANNEILNAYAHGLKQQIERTAKDQEEVSVLRHDIRHRANLIQYYLREGNVDAVREMAVEVSTQLDETVERRFCADNALNWVLNSSVRKAAERRIRFECSAEIPPLPETMELEFGTVILNLLENAFNAAGALKEEKRFVRFSVRRVKGQAFLRVDNSYSGTIAFSPDTKLPVSKEGEGHGFGMRSVLAFALRHHATFECTAEENVFHANLLIPLTEGL
jgi:hypothetical protein